MTRTRPWEVSDETKIMIDLLCCLLEVPQLRHHAEKQGKEAWSRFHRCCKPFDLTKQRVLLRKGGTSSLVSPVLRLPSQAASFSSLVRCFRCFSETTNRSLLILDREHDLDVHSN